MNVDLKQIRVQNHRNEGKEKNPVLAPPDEHGYHRLSAGPGEKQLGEGIMIKSHPNLGLISLVSAMNAP